MSSKNELIDVALKSFMVEGYQKTSLNKIATELGMTKAALYYYYPNKKSLFMACLDTFFSQINTSATGFRTKGDTIKEQLYHVIYYFTDIEIQTKEVPGFNHYYFVFDAMKHVPEVKDLFLQTSNEFMSELVSLVQEGIATGEIKDDIDIDVVLMEIGVFIEGLTICRYLGYFEDNDSIIRSMYELIWRGIKK